MRFSLLLLTILILFSNLTAAKPDCGTESVEILKNDTITTLIRCSKDSSWTEVKKKNGKLHGQIKTYYQDGKIKRISMIENGKENGITKGWLPDGFISIYKPYHNGTPVDTHKVWYENKNQESIIIYDSTGQKNGWCRTWYENGKLQDSTLFTHGTKLQEFLYYDNGKPMFTSTLKNDGYILSAQSWFPDGKKNGEIKNGNGKVLTPRTGNQYFDTLVVKNGKVQGGAYEFFKDR